MEKTKEKKRRRQKRTMMKREKGVILDALGLKANDATGSTYSRIKSDIETQRTS
jgi:hypothetical protein